MGKQIQSFIERTEPSDEKTNTVMQILDELTSVISWFYTRLLAKRPAHSRTRAKKTC
jgi:hypothetical protein